MSAKKKYFPLNFIYLIHKACQILSTLPVSVTVSISTVSAFFLTLTSHIPIDFTVIPQHMIISPIHCIGYKELVKNTSQSLLVRCTALSLWSTLNRCHIYIYWFINPRRFTIFSKDDVKNLNKCVTDFCVMSVVWSVSVRGSCYSF